MKMKILKECIKHIFPPEFNLPQNTSILKETLGVQVDLNSAQKERNLKKKLQTLSLNNAHCLNNFLVGFL